ncbi:MAG: hypothetical protein JW836_15775 [Deltaproteobacteria bacterium]|nr:hypothetical protein [Deltaproteobacteria bacterium]
MGVPLKSAKGRESGVDHENAESSRMSYRRFGNGTRLTRYEGSAMMQTNASSRAGF